jgi:hypothetical protein
MTDTCGNCVFGREHSEEDKKPVVVRCHRYPPQVTRVRDGDFEDIEVAFPLVFPENGDWCGEHQS